MTTAIVYYSKHHGNTKKLVDAIGSADPSLTLIDVTEQPDAELSSYDRIGIASGIYFTSFAKQVLAFVIVSVLIPSVRSSWSEGSPKGTQAKKRSLRR